MTRVPGEGKAEGEKARWEDRGRGWKDAATNRETPETGRGKEGSSPTAFAES